LRFARARAGEYRRFKWLIKNGNSFAVHFFRVMLNSLAQR
jgi:hypothetical protein